MRYIVSVIKPDGKSKSVSVEAGSCKNAIDLVKEKYPDSEVDRATSSQTDIDYFDGMKKMRKKRVK